MLQHLFGELPVSMHDSMVRIVLAALVAEWKAAKPTGSRQIHFQGGYVYNIYHVPATSTQQSTSAGNDFSKHKPYWFHKIQANYRYLNNLKHPKLINIGILHVIGAIYK